MALDADFDDDWKSQSSGGQEEGSILCPLYKSTHHPLERMVDISDVSEIVEQQRISKQVDEKPEMCIAMEELAPDSDEEAIASSLHTSPLHGVHRPSFDHGNYSPPLVGSVDEQEADDEPMIEEPAALEN